MPIRNRAAALAAALIAILVGATGAGAITNGQPDGDNHPYVGVMVGVNFTDGLAWLCTGSLLDENSFLTAGHCTQGADAIFIWFDQTLTQPISLATADAVGSGMTNPDFCEGCANGLPGFARRDVGVVELVPISDDIPTEYADLPIEGAVDTLENKTPIDFVGYGVTFQAQIQGSQLPQPPPFYRWDGLGTRMFAQGQTVSGNFKHSAEFLKLTMNPGGGSGGVCFGDSGGPNLLAGTDTVLAVNSYGPNSNCSGVGYSQRIDVPDVLTWVKSFVN